MSLTTIQRGARLSRLLSTDFGLDWRDEAACVELDPELFFSFDATTTRLALEACDGCPVMMQCRRWADAERIQYGVWGGETEEQRKYRWAASRTESTPGGTAGKTPNKVCPHCVLPFVGRNDQKYCSARCHHLSMTTRHCGSVTAAKRHRQKGEPLDAACRTAERDYTRHRREIKRREAENAAHA